MTEHERKTAFNLQHHLIELGAACEAFLNMTIESKLAVLGKTALDDSRISDTLADNWKKIKDFSFAARVPDAPYLDSEEFASEIKEKMNAEA